MNQSPSLEEFHQTMRSLGGAFYEWVVSQTTGIPWSRATLEARYAPDGAYWHDKIRVECPERTISLGTTDAIRTSLVRLNDLRRVLGWCSFSLAVDPARSVTIDYGYDAASVDDPAFFAD